MSSQPQQGRFGIVFASQIDADVSDAAFRLFVRLTSYADKEGRCWPSVSTLARASNVQQRQIYKLLQELADAGLIIREPQYRKDGSQCSSTTLIPVRAEQASLSSQDRGDWAVTTVLEQTRGTDHLTDHPKNVRAAGAEEEDDMPPVWGSLDDEAEMPEAGASTVRKKKAFEEAPTVGTHGWAVYEFERAMRQANCGRHGFNRSVLNGAFKALRGEGYSNAEIVTMAKTFWVRYGDEVRAKRELDVAVAFRHRVPQLKDQTQQTIEDKRAGRKTTLERSRELSEANKARLMENRGKQ